MKKLAVKKNETCMACLQCVQACSEAFYKENDVTVGIYVNYNGQKYIIYKNSTDMIRTLDYGNITNISGVPMVIFGMAIEN